MKAANDGKKQYNGFSKLNSFTRHLKEHRRSYRYPVEARVKIVCGDFITETRSVDVSTHGLCLKDKLPAELAGQVIDVYITYISSLSKELTAFSKCRCAADSLNRLIIVDTTYGLDIFLENIWRQPHNTY